MRLVEPEEHEHGQSFLKQCGMLLTCCYSWTGGLSGLPGYRVDTSRGLTSKAKDSNSDFLPHGLRTTTVDGTIALPVRQFDNHTRDR